MIIGGTLGEIPEPHKRKFSDKRRKRRVTVSVSVYSGIGHHYWVRLREEENPIWDSSSDDWRIAFDDKDAHGDSISKPFDTSMQARAFVYDEIAKKFPNHKVIWDTNEDTQDVLRAAIQATISA